MYLLIGSKEETAGDVLLVGRECLHWDCESRYLSLCARARGIEVEYLTITACSPEPSDHVYHSRDTNVHVHVQL